ncbi:MAG: carboxypeptidase regulatory-like domain-containing protein [Polyangiales bacterium]
MTGATGATGDPGAAGEAGPPGEAGVLEGTIQGTVIATDSRPLAGVTVTLTMGGAPIPSDAGSSGTTTTAADGTFSFPNLAIGAYALSFAEPGFTSKSISVGNSTGGPTVLAVTMASDTTPGVDAPTFKVAITSSNGLTDPYAVGFGTTVTVALTNIGETGEATYGAAAFTYKWTIGTAVTSANPTGAYTFSPAPTSTSTTASFTTMTVAQTKSVETYAVANPVDAGNVGYFARLGVLGFNPDETGRYTVGITASDPEGHNYSFSQTIKSTWQAPGIADVPVGNPVYLQGDTFAAPNWLQQGTSYWKWPNTSWTWSFSSCTDASGTAFTCPTLNDAATQYPSFLPASAGTYVLSVTQASTYANAGTTGLGLDAGPGPGGAYGTETDTLTVYAGGWLGIMNGGSTSCTSCHVAGGGGGAPDMFSPWNNTSHASAMKRKIDGLATSHFGESCLECHTLGWSEVATAQTASNGGFFFEQATQLFGGVPWAYPSPMTSTSYSTMVTDYPILGNLGGIQCENCHGPASGAAVAHPGNLAGNSTEVGFVQARASWSAEVCASCHEEAKSHFFPGQWALTKHGNIQVAQQRASVESKATTYGGGADLQSGAQFCARCHSAQGFARYVNMLKNGVFGRYDFITMDDKKLSATNAPTTAWLSSIGLNAAEVQSQTCQACHDPHSNGAYSAAYGSDAGVLGPVDCSQQANNANPACMQLRIYDHLPGLPSGQGAISGVGEGALCMACHNGRNGEHTDTFNSAPYAETPHDSTATEALFGFNAFFVPRYNPSPHLAVEDTCSGCHVKIPTAAEADAGYSSNHGFVTDLTICQNCHGSAAVDGKAIQSQVSTEMASLNTAITAAIKGTIMNANAANGLCVQVSSISDANCTGGSCKSSQVVPAVPFPVPISNVWIPAGQITAVTGSSTTATITLKTGLNIPYFDPKTLAYVSTTSGTVKMSVPIYTIVTGVTDPTTCAGSSTAMGGIVGTTANQLFPASTPAGFVAGSGPDPSIIPKAIWNYNMLSNEGSGGLHNFPWTTAVLQATLTQLGTWAP